MARENPRSGSRDQPARYCHRAERRQFGHSPRDRRARRCRSNRAAPARRARHQPGCALDHQLGRPGELLAGQLGRQVQCHVDACRDAGRAQELAVFHPPLPLVMGAQPVELLGKTPSAWWRCARPRGRPRRGSEPPNTPRQPCAPSGPPPPNTHAGQDRPWPARCPGCRREPRRCTGRVPDRTPSPG